MFKVRKNISSQLGVQKSPNRISKSAKYRICITTIANSIYLWPNVGSSWWPGPKTYNYWSEIQRENSIKTNTTRIFKWQNYIWWVAPIFNAVKSNVSGIPCCPLCCSYKYGYGVSVNKMNLWNCKSSDTMKYSQLCQYSLYMLGPRQLDVKVILRYSTDKGYQLYKQWGVIHNQSENIYTHQVTNVD